MDGFELHIEEVFSIENMGVIVAGTYNQKGTISAGEKFQTKEGKVYTVLSVTYFPKPGQVKMGLKMDCTLEEAKALIHQTLKK